MLFVPEESVMVTENAPRSMITVSLVPGKRAVGRVWVPYGPNCPEPVTGAAGAMPLFQLVMFVHWPLVLFIQSAGMRLSLRNSQPPCATSTSMLELPLLYPLSLAVLAYCQNVHG